MKDFTMADFKAVIRTVNDFPKVGVQFKDITTLLADPDAFSALIEQMAKPWQNIDAVVGIEARGFIFGTPLALKLGASFIPARKPGKLPSAVVKQTYALEYGTDSLEIHADAFIVKKNVLIVDDVLATGGTALATAKLVQQAHGHVQGFVFAIELGFLHGREKIKEYNCQSVIMY